MSTITTRSGKGSPLTNNEVDSNFTNLNTDKAELSGATFTGEIVANAGIALGDNDKATFGAGDDLQIYHDGSNSYIDESATGSLLIRGSNLQLRSYGTNEYFFTGVENGASTIYYDGLSKLATTATGIDVTGSVVADGLTVDGDVLLQGNRDLHLVATNPNLGTSFQYGEITFGESHPAQYINHAKITSRGTYGNQSSLEFHTSTNNSSPLRMDISNIGDISFYDQSGTSQALFWDASTSRLGLGVTNPARPLDVNGAIRVKSASAIEWGGVNEAIIGDTGGALIYKVGGAERMRNTATGLGIGTSSPSAKVEIYDTQNTQLRVNTASHGYLDLSNYSNGAAVMTSAAHPLRLGTANTERARLDASGNWLVGKTAADFGASAGAEIRPDGRIAAGRAGETLVLNRLTSDGAIALFRKNGTTVGSIGVAQSGDRTYFSGGSYGIASDTSEAIIMPCGATGTGNDGVLSLGKSTARFKDLYLSGGLRGDTTFKNNAGTTEYARFDSLGNLLVGTTDANPTNNSTNSAADRGIAFSGGQGWTANATYNETTAYFNRTGTDGTIIDLIKSGTTVGSIGVAAGNRLTIGDGDTGLRMSGSLNTIVPWNVSNNTLVDNAIDLGEATGRFKDLYLSGSVKTGSGLDLTDGTSIFGSIAVSSSSLALNARNTGVMLFQSGGAEKARINAAGNLLVGKTGLDVGVVGQELRSSGYMAATRDGSTVGSYTRLNSDGTILEFRKDGTAVGSIGIEAAGFTIDGETGHTGLQFGYSAIIPRDNGSNTDGANDLGASVHRFKDLYLSGGVKGNNLTFSGNGSAEHARIDTSGNLLVGTTSQISSGKLSVAGGASANGITATTSATAGYAAASFQRTASDGELISFKKGATTVGSIGTTSSQLYIGTGDTGLFLNSSSDTIQPINATAGTIRDGLIDLGSSGARFKDLYLSGGVYLGGTGAANKLDDYESGTFTPVFSFGGNSVGLTYQYQVGSYVKVGDLVTAQIFIQLLSKGTSTGELQVSGLPFTTYNLATALHTFPVRLKRISYVGSPTGYADTNVSFLRIEQVTEAGVNTKLTNANCPDNAEIMITFTYRTN